MSSHRQHQHQNQPTSPNRQHRPHRGDHPLSSSQTSAATFPSSDSENYDANHSNSPDSRSDEEAIPASSSSSSPLILYSPPTFWSIVRGAAINILLPFVNGLMLGFGELVAHEFAWRLGWGGTKVRFLSLFLSPPVVLLHSVCFYLSSLGYEVETKF